ncbi:MAG: HaeII family restriction endonuclease [Elusimicrobia bacterium]|nr:HaeII family restriction endonuclease [Elusimicrobiota bacterium]
MTNPTNPKDALDRIIKKSRVHFYKPIQIAEILHKNRTGHDLDLWDVESYRNISKKWRDIISERLVGRKSSSSQKYQDNIFEGNAMPPKILKLLGDINKKGAGFIEAYIYECLKLRLTSVYEVEEYIKNSTADSFSFKEFVSLFQKTPGLKRSIDKMYEISVYALFSAIVQALQVQIAIEIKNKDKAILKDFESFISMVLGIDVKDAKLTIPAAIYRAGTTNAADKGLDMWANFGVAIQVKHLALTSVLAEDISEYIPTDRIIIVCKDAEGKLIETLLKQVGLRDKIQGIVTISDLSKWYSLCLSLKYRDKLGKNLLKNIEREFKAEFPSIEKISPFLRERGYNKVAFPKDWQLNG